MILINIVILSGKGGTGKTLVSTNLASYMKINYIDADVEEPNGFIFLNPKIEKQNDVLVDIPYINEEKCQKCYKCVDFCAFNVFSIAKDKISIFDKMCHSCGGCKIICPFGAIDYQNKKLGVIEEGYANDLYCKRGVLKIGEPISVPIIKQLLENLKDGINIIDSSPGTSCNVVNTLAFSDKAILVTEPTEFGLHDLKRAIKIVLDLKIPFGIIINRVTNEDNLVKNYCEKNNYLILGTIKYDKKIAELYSEGKLLLEEKEYISNFDKISQKIKEELLWK